MIEATKGKFRKTVFHMLGVRAIQTVFVIEIMYEVKGLRFCLFAAIAYAAIAHLPRSAGIESQIKKLVYNNNGFGTYTFEFQTKDGTFRKEDGGIVTKDGRGYVVRGEYGYIDPKGGHHLVRYLADANGFQPLTDDDFRSNDRRII